MLDQQQPAGLEPGTLTASFKLLWLHLWHPSGLPLLCVSAVCQPSAAQAWIIQTILSQRLCSRLRAAPCSHFLSIWTGLRWQPPRTCRLLSFNSRGAYADIWPSVYLTAAAAQGKHARIIRNSCQDAAQNAAREQTCWRIMFRTKSLRHVSKSETVSADRISSPFNL